ncbi:ctenidin-1-like [Plutella xylostella]|uniref:ctenidin-1-like n=1 Tax=Plutella xylostella TaxID=51655 RepID=UPI00203245AE|nr:ctenidin-1-like [Plutella xylostella]
MALSKTIISLAMCVGILAVALADRSRGGLSSSQGGGFEIESDRRISGSRGSSESSSGGRHSGGLSGGRNSGGGLSGGRHGGLDSLSGGYQSSGGSLDKLRGNSRGSEHSDTRRGFESKSNSNRY